VAGGGHAVAVDQASKDDVEDKDYDDDNVADHKLNQCGKDPPGSRGRIFPTHPVGSLLRPAEHNRMDVGYTDDSEQNENDETGVTRRAEPTSAVWTGNTYDAFERQTRNQPVGVVSGDAVSVVGRTAVRRVGDEALRWNYLLRPRSTTRDLAKATSITPSVVGMGLPSNTIFLGSLGVSAPDRMSIRLAVFARPHNRWTD